MEPLSETPTAAPPGEERVQPGRLWNRNFVLLWQGQTISQFGNLAFSFAMMLWLKDATGSASLMGLMMFASLLPGVLLGPFGGTFADRHSRIRIALVCDLLSGVAVLGLAFAMFAPRVASLQPGAVRFAIGFLFGVSVFVGILRAFFTPALSAAIPDLVPRDKIPAANSLNQFSVQGSTLLGQAIGGLLYQTLGAPLLFLIDGVSFLYAGICAGFIRLPPREKKPASEHPFGDFLKETGEGFRYLWRRPGLRDFIGIASVVNFFGMPIAVLLPFYVESYLKADDKWYGFLMAFIGAGSVFGFILAGALSLTGRARQRGILAAMLLAPSFFGVLGSVTNAYLAMAMVFLGGASVGFINVYLMSMIQVSTPDEVRGRVMGVVLTLSGGLMPLGMVLGGVVGDLTGKNVPLVYALCGGAAFLVSLLGLRRDLREFLTNG
jgi:DHA3 family macrolide efflux protein-like MFS transporter